MTAKQPNDGEGEQQRRECLMCGRDCAIVRKVGPLELKEPCPNKCGAGYVKPQNARLDQCHQ